MLGAAGMTRAPIKPELFVWARERAGMESEALTKRFRKLPEWERGEALPTIKQAKDFARAVDVPIGYLFLSEPPEEILPIQDFRTFEGMGVDRPSPDLLDMIHICQERQHWFREFAKDEGQPELSFVGSATVKTAPETVAAQIRKILGFNHQARKNCRTWTDALRLLVRQAEAAGILVMVSGIVMSNTHRRLDPGEFRGFALSDSLAPLVFVNGSDTKASQMFTIVHEIGHLWLGASALSNMDASSGTGFRPEEIWCNAVAAELLVPLDALRAELEARDDRLENLKKRLARDFKVSTLVILRRLLDSGRIDRERFDDAWRRESDFLCNQTKNQVSGGDFLPTTLSRVGRRFARALVASTLEGHTSYRDACRMLGISSLDTLDNIGYEVGVLG